MNIKTKITLQGVHIAFKDKRN